MKRTFFALFSLVMLISCQNPPQGAASQQHWDEYLFSQMPLLGHRNWIVVSDMAYPLQSGSGITTVYADEPYTEVVAKVKKMIDDSPHVFAHIYNDLELSFIREEDMPGITALRSSLKDVCGDEVCTMKHEDLIARLDAAGKLYSVIIIKTPLTMAYTTTFFELDCNYWGAAKQARLDAALR